MRLRTILAVALVATALVSARCTDDAASGPGPQTEVLIGQQLRFKPATVRVRAGHPVLITLRNPDPVDHDFVLAGMPATDIDDESRGGHSHSGADDHGAVDVNAIVAHAGPGAEARVWFTPMQPGRYQFYCSLPGHRESGMVGTLLVE